MFRDHLLGLLHNANYHGYALAKEYHRRSGVEVSLGGIYRELRALSDQGLVRRLSTPQDGDPRRAPYEITEKGRRAFEDWFRELPPSTPCEESELAVRIMFFAEVAPEDARAIVEQWRQGLWGLSKRCEAELQRNLTRDGSAHDSRALLLRRRMGHIAFELEFLDEVERTIASFPVAREDTVRVLEPMALPRRARART
jgi:DNA-binding PadR family transcriptional regulator